jgi:uncharacterized protein
LNGIMDCRAFRRGDGASRLSPGNDGDTETPTPRTVFRHARLYAGHPRLTDVRASKTWMAGTSPAMTEVRLALPGDRGGFFLLPAALQRRVRHVYVSGCGGRQMDEKTRTELEAAVYRRLVEHLRSRTDVQNIDMMNLAGFCRNCLSNWMKEAADAQGVSMSKDESREVVYGMPFDEWRKKYQKEASPDQKAAFEKSRSGH